MFAPIAGRPQVRCQKMRKFVLNVIEMDVILRIQLILTRLLAKPFIRLPFSLHRVGDAARHTALRARTEHLKPNAWHCNLLICAM